MGAIPQNTQSFGRFPDLVSPVAGLTQDEGTQFAEPV